MTQLVLTAVGDDREGLVSALAGTVETHGGNWLDSQLSRLAGKFAGIVLVELPAEGVAEFTSACARLRQEIGWNVEVSPVGSGGVEGSEVRMHLVGLDRPGMVRQVTAALAEQHVSIRELRSWTPDAPQGGGSLFEADAVITLANDVHLDVVRRALEPIADELMVDLDLSDPDGQ
ncbi:transcriptional regulator [Occultella glacieicola]|uniref:Transcriptional regulator n=1 Tax=Occultella glacieicola TaxID=2518684 RepID=A0ABY2E1N6_9MICO|nr:ACT domain-containing protein [Occultella glacieicola]TDE92535.1 transcriptional regulator [Occultella glacieicola]